MYSSRNLWYIYPFHSPAKLSVLSIMVQLSSLYKMTDLVSVKRAYVYDMYICNKQSVNCWKGLCP